MFPPLPYLIDIEGGLEGGEAVKDSEGGGGSQLQQSIVQKVDTKGYLDPPPPT